MTVGVGVGSNEGVSELHEQAIITIARTVPSKAIQNFLVVFMFILLFHDLVKFFLAGSFPLVTRKKVLEMPRAYHAEIVLSV
jgi:hypothetical protein